MSAASGAPGTKATSAQQPGLAVFLSTPVRQEDMQPGLVPPRSPPSGRKI